MINADTMMCHLEINILVAFVIHSKHPCIFKYTITLAVKTEEIYILLNSI